MAIAAVLATAFAAGVLDQDAAHSLGRGGKEMAPAVASALCISADQPEVCLVHERRGAERLPRLFLSQLRRRQLAQLVVDQRQELLGGARVALLDSGQNARDLTHRRHGTARTSQRKV